MAEISTEAGLRPHMSRRQSLKHVPGALALFLYVLLSLALTYPLILHFSSHVPGSETWAFDEYTFVYNLWWFKYALLDLGVNPLYSDYIWVPVGINFVLYTYTLFNAVLSLPLQPFLGLIATSNLLMILSTALSGYGTYLLLRYLLLDLQRAGRLSPAGLWWAAFLGGLAYAFAGNRFIYLALGHYDMVSTEWLPFFALFLVKTIRERAWINPVLAGLFATFAMLCEMIYGVFLAILAVILLIFEVRSAWAKGVLVRVPNARGFLANRIKPASRLSIVGRLALLACVAGITYGPVLAAILKEASKGYMLSGWGDALKLSADLWSFVTPTALHPLWGSDWTQELAAVRQGIARFADVNTVIVGWGMLAVAVLACVVYWRKVNAWAVTALTFAILCLGPLLQINGRYQFDLDGLKTTFPLPFIILHYLPIVKGNRAPNRNSVMLMLAIAVLVGFGVAWLLARLGRRQRRTWAIPVLSVALAGLLLFEHISVPLPLTDARVPAFYNQLAEEPGDFTIMTLPLGWRDSFGVLGAEDTRTQYYQTVHHKRLLSGNSGRHEPFKKAYYEAIPFFKALTEIELYQDVDEVTRRLAREQAPALAYLYDVRYVVVHPPVLGRFPYVDTWDEAERFVLEAMPLDRQPIYEQDGLRVYRVIQPPAQDGFRMDLGEEGWELYRGEGWDRNEDIAGHSAVWATAQGARIFIPLREVKDRRLLVRAWPFDYPGASPQTLEVRLNGHALGPAQALSAGWGEYYWDVPAAWQRYGINEITFYFARVDCPRDVLPANRAIGRTGLSTPVDIEVNSLSAEQSAIAYVTIDDGKRRVDGSMHNWGYNIAVLDPVTGAVVARAAFDTTASESEARAMAKFIAGITEGQIVIAAMRGDGATYLTNEAVAALQSLGSGVDPRQDLTRSHALIGVKGAAPGTAAEVWEPGQSWLRLGRYPDDRTLAVAFDELSLE